MSHDKRPLVLFDAMGVIYPFPEGDDVKYGLWPFLESKGFVFSDQERLDMEMGPYRAATRGEISSLDFFRTILPAGTDVKAIEREYLYHEQYPFASDFIDIVRRLREAGSSLECSRTILLNGLKCCADVSVLMSTLMWS